MEENTSKLGAEVVDTEEPLDKNSPLWSMDNVIVTPHNSFQGENNLERLVEVVMKNLSI